MRARERLSVETAEGEGHRVMSAEWRGIVDSCTCTCMYLMVDDGTLGAVQITVLRNGMETHMHHLPVIVQAVPEVCETS